MAEGMGNASIARDLRDLIDKRVMQVVDQNRPPYQYATVESIDVDGQTAWLVFTGSTNAVPVRYGSVAPTAAGQVVRVDGRPGDRFIVDVIGGGTLVDVVPADLPAVAGLAVSDGPTSLYVDWTANASPRYEVNVADDSGFTTNNRSFITQSNALTVDNLNTGTTYYVRVRSRNSSTGAGAWTATATGTPTATGVPPTDGIAPTSSPTPTVTGGIAQITAEWVAATGTVDTITYEVHMSTTSGFTTSAATLLLETTSRFTSTQFMPDGTSLATLYGTNVFVRIIAKDPDGAAAVGAQGFAAPLKVQTGDVGTIQLDQVSDLTAPASSPAVTLASGVGYLFAAWDAVTNADALTYEVHLSTTTGFTPNINTLVGTTPSLFFFVTNESTQINPLEPAVDYLTTYYCKIVATDVDGAAAAGTQDSASPVNPATVNNTTVEAAAIRSDKYGTVMPQLAIGEVAALNANLTNLTSATAEIWSANIQNLAVGTAEIADLSVANGKIADLAVNNAKISDLAADKITAGTIGAHTITLNGASSILESSNFVSGTSGWQIKGDGTLEANTGTFRGDLEAATIDIPNAVDTASWHVDSLGNMWSGSAAIGTAPFSVTAAGSAHALDLNTTGSLVVGGSIFMANGGYINSFDNVLALRAGMRVETDFAAGNPVIAFQRPSVAGSSATVLDAEQYCTGTNLDFGGGVGDTTYLYTINGYAPDGFDNAPGNLSHIEFRRVVHYAPQIGYTTFVQDLTLYADDGISLASDTVVTGALTATSNVYGSYLYATNNRLYFGAGSSTSYVDFASSAWNFYTSGVKRMYLNSTGRLLVTGDLINFNSTSSYGDYLQASGGTFWLTAGGTSLSFRNTQKHHHYSTTVGTGSWTYLPLVVEDQKVGTPIAGIAMHQPNKGLAPVVRASNAGNYVVVLSSDNSTFIPVHASAFTVSSRPEVKRGMKPAPAGALDKLTSKTIHHFRRDHDAEPLVAFDPEVEGDEEAIKARRLRDATKKDWANLNAQMSGPEFIERGVDVTEWTDVPDVVTWDSDDAGVMQPMGINLASYVSFVAQAVQELAAEVRALKAAS